MKQPTTKITLFILFLLAWLSPAWSVETVRLGFFESKGMFEGASDNEQKSGYCYDYMMQIANYTGWDYEFVYGSFADLYDMLKNGQIDILPYTNYNSQRGREVLFSNQAIAEEEYYLAVKPETQSLEGAVISTMKNADYNELLFDYIRKNNLHVQVNYYHYVDQIWDALRNNEANATIYTSNSYSNDGWKYIGNFGKKPTYICVKKDRPDLLRQLNEAADLIEKESPALKNNLFAKYFSDNPMRKNVTVEEQLWIDAHPVLHVGCFTNDAPDIFSYDEETHTATGLTVDVINGIIERMELGTSADFRCYLSIDDMEAALDSGIIDVIFPFYPSYYVAQEHNMLISNTVRVSNMELVYKKKATYADALQVIATPQTRLGIFYVKDNFHDSEVLGAVTIQDAVNKVLLGQATGAIAQNIVMHNIKEKYNNLNYLVLPQGCGTCFAARPENVQLIRILNRGLNYFTTAEISSIAAKYTLDPNMTAKAFLASHGDIFMLLIIILASIIVLVIVLIQVARLKKKADEANQSKTAFLFNMSHDIRTPMNAILGYTDVALRHFNDPEKAQDSLKKIKSSGQHLLKLINDILEMSRIESGAMELTETPSDLRIAITNADEMGQALAIPKSIDFKTVTGQIDNPYVYADTLHLNEVIINLISNAVKYTEPGGNIRYIVDQVGTTPDGKALFRFEIADNGIGMSEEFQEHLFEAFSREKTSTVTRQEGAGLGLSIVKRIVDMSSGSIKVQSKQGQGTTFTVEMPFRTMEERAIKHYLKKNSQSDVAIKEDVDLEGKSVLLVEDNEMNREIATMILKESGLVVETAEDGQIAYDMVKEKGASHYDYILMDIQMPVMDGYQATAMIRRLPGADKLVIIALSANAFDEDRRKSRSAGMDGHVAKPIDVNELIHTMKKLAR